MAKGRKSAADLSIVPLVPGTGRPEPPTELDPLEAQLWRGVVASLPDHWVDAAAQMVLRRAVAQLALCERFEARLRQLSSDGLATTKDAIRLTQQHGAAAKLGAYLLAQLRATPRARKVSREAGPLVRDAPRFKPWEIRSTDDSA